MRAGVYYIESADKIVFLFKTRTYENAYNVRTKETVSGKVCICDWEDENGVHSLVLLMERQFKLFKRLGGLYD